MNIISSFIIRNKSELVILVSLFVIALSITIYQFSVWEGSLDRTEWNSLALFSGDEPFYLELTSTIVYHHSLNLDDFYKAHNRDPSLVFPDLYYEVDSCRLHHSFLGRDGHCWHSVAGGLPFLLTPGYAIGGAVGAMITMNMLFALQGVLIFKFLTRFVTRTHSLLSTLIFSLSTITLTFSTEIYPDFVAGFFLLASLYLFFGREKNLKNLSAAGATIGFLPFLKLEFVVLSLLLLIIMVVVLIKKKNMDGLIVLVCFFLVFILALAWFMVYSSPVETSPGFGGGYTDIAKSTLATKATTTMENLTKGLGNLLFGRSYGLFVFSPVALLSLFGMKYVWRKDKALAISIILLFSVLVTSLSLTIPYAAGWTLPSRYLMPILSLTVIPFAFLFENFSKKIIFQTLVLTTTYLGVSFNILFARIIYDHPTVEMRANIANQVYLGGAHVFPYLGVSDSGIATFWNSSGPFFWIFLGSIITIFCTFTFFSKVKRSFNNLQRRERYIVISSVLTICILISIYAYDAVYEYQIELQITQFYQSILGRSPDTQGLSDWKNEVLHEGKSLEWVAEKMRTSPEGIATKKITSFYNDILNRQPDPDGLAYWKKTILTDGKSYDWVENMIRNSVEAGNLKK